MDARGVIRSTVLGVFGLAVAVPTAAQDLELGVSTGINITSGDYGGDVDIAETYVPVSVTATYGQVSFGVRVPYLSVTTDSETGSTTEDGLGDVSASLTVLDVLYSAEHRLAVDVSGVVKFGTADAETQLGTGENDFTIYLDGYKFFDKVTLLGSVGYRWRGESADTVLDDVVIGSVGAAFFTDGGAMFGGIFDYGQSAISGEDDVREARAFVAMPLNQSWDLEVYAFTGFTDSSPDWGGGMTVACDLSRFALRERR
ncbi:MAG: hypothetical protein QNI98_09745 [Woeseiaceae bacterium]|nr:hypothetical protein [Woeseiaceae bacterium]